jgi:hypothetical protein
VQQVQSTVNKSADTITLGSNRPHCRLNVQFINRRTLEVRNKNTADFVTADFVTADFVTVDFVTADFVTADFVTADFSRRTKLKLSWNHPVRYWSTLLYKQIQ